MGPINGGPINLKSACLQDAGLRFANLSAANLEAADMSGADLSHARLNQANLSAAKLSNALLDHADFADANLTKVNLCGASLRSATLSTADLGAADMSGADLSHARLNQANLSAAKLSNALLDHADFAGANLTKVNLCGASLHHAKNLTQSQLEESIGSDSTILPRDLRGSVAWSADSQTETTALERRDLRPRAGHTADVDVPHISSHNRPVWIVAVLLLGGTLATTGVVWQQMPLDTPGAQSGSEQSLIEPKPSLSTGEQELQPSAPEALMETKAAAERRPSADSKQSLIEPKPSLDTGDQELQPSAPEEKAAAEPQPSADAEIPPMPSAANTADRTENVPEQRPALEEGGGTVPQETSAKRSTEAFGPYEHAPASPEQGHESKSNEASEAPPQMVLPRDTGTPPMPVGDPARLSAAATNLAAEEPTTPPQDGARWSEFQSPGRGFAVSFPSTPQANSAAVAGLNPLVRYSFQANEGDDTVYTVVVLDYRAGKAPNPPEPDLYAKMVSAYAKDSQSRVRKKGPATIADHEGFEAIMDAANAKVDHLVDIVPAGDRIYMLISAGPKGHAASDDAVRFRDSFRLTGDRSQSAARLAPSPCRERTSILENMIQDGVDHLSFPSPTCR